MTPKRGRPHGLLANPDAFADAMDGRTQKHVAEQAGLSVSHLNEMLMGTKGASNDVAVRLAEVLKCRPGTLFPQIANFRIKVRTFSVQDAPAEAAA